MIELKCDKKLTIIVSEYELMMLVDALSVAAGVFYNYRKNEGMAWIGGQGFGGRYRSKIGELIERIGDLVGSIDEYSPGAANIRTI